MSQPDLSELLAKAQEMQGRLAKVQRELARRTVEASAGGGMVTVVASGELRVIEVRIEPSLIQSGDRAMLQDLIAAAANAALADAQKMVQEEMQRVAGLPLFATPGAQETS
jgi:DNA-binding YbaB/EbfC family protein